jgi:gliding motility-associated-like protein
MRKTIILLISLIFPVMVFATHERAGEITFRHISGLTYEFTVTTYTYTPSPADRDSLEVKWGDGTLQNVARVEKINFPNDISRNKYIINHTFPASGYYTVSMEDPNRNYGVINIPNSVNIPFYIETSLLINPFIAANNSPILLNPPIDNGCVGVPFYHNPGAYDPDGDSLSYEIVECKGLSGDVIPGYSIPSYTISLSIDPYTGDFYWDSPIIQGEYNIAILINEYREGVKIGSLIRDMQISIGSCNNQPPHIETIADTCIVAGTNLSFLVKATDPNMNYVTLTATGGAFSTTNPAYFSQPVSGLGTVQSTFIWNTSCENVRKYPYQATFKAKDNGIPISLVSMRTVRITIVAPAPEMLSVNPTGSNMRVEWGKSPCANAIGYKIFRHEGVSGWVHGYCETGVPSYTGFHLVGTTTSINDTTFIDNNNEIGMLYGTQYCYVVIATFPDFAESYASNEMCAALKKDVPIITNVSITTTDLVSGQLYLAWSKPTAFDTIQFPGPYEYRLMKTETNQNNYVQVYSTSNLNDTIISDLNTNTKSKAWRYKIDFFNNTLGDTSLIGTSNPASSIFAIANPSDNRVTLNWNENVPWINDRYDIFRFNTLTSTWDSIGNSTLQTYTDFGLSNGVEYCYYVRSVGRYTITGITDPLINLSQQVCATPVDNIPPCNPILSGNTDCSVNYFTWHFLNDSCFNDVVKYKVFYSPSQTDGFTLIDSITNPLITSISYTGINSIAGCFMVEAIDSNNNISQSNYVCIDIDSCSLYDLPNVFTPNGDGFNDTFHPFPYDYVEHININIFNRWGNLVFTSINPDINWDGKDKNSKQDCVDGVYFYICDVFEYRLGGIKVRTIYGSVSLYR